MNIVHIYKDYFPVLGGIENHIRVLAEAQAATGHKVTVVVTNPGAWTRREELNGVRIVKAARLGTVASMPLSLIQPFLLLQESSHIVHIHSPYPLGEVSNWLLGRSQTTVITYHSDVVRQKGLLLLYAPFLRQVLNSAHRIIVTSPRYIETSPWLNPVREKCEVIPLGIDLERFHPPAAFYDGPPTILFVGKLRYYKGLDTLLQAIVDLPQVTLKIIGNGPMRESWERLPRSLGIASRVQFLGEVDEGCLPSLFHQAHLFVLPAKARAEAFGTVLLEAMASSLPCITTEVGTGTSWVVQNNQTGLVVPPDDPVALARAIKCLFKNKDRLQRMGLAGRKRTEDHFSVHRMISRVEDLYRALIAEK